ncbi:hypothetical protein [Herbidospora daliensis]|uniref:hypothetical protein n=1 Tax=Herbidospora daliensis TaxID=295585 RepID=UPI00078031BC|nr:hypothetical protein [Herbidospora daliensis]
MSPLWRQLLRIGFAAGRGAPGSRIRFAGLLLASAVLTTTMLAGLVVVATYDGRAQRDAARGPVPAGDGVRAPAAWLNINRDAVGTVPHSVIHVEPLAESIDPPPGLPRWPERGEVFLSPALLEAGSSERILHRYGTFAGLIGDAGLSSPGERLAYVRPDVDGGYEGWRGIKRFGGVDTMLIGDSRDVAPIGQFLTMLAATLGVAAAVLLVVAVRSGSAARDRRTELLAALGASWRHRALLNVGEGVVPALAGAVIGLTPYLVTLITDVRLPGPGFVIDSDDTRAWLWAVPPTVAGSVVFVLLAIVTLHRVDAAGRSGRPRTFAGRVPRWRLVAGVAGLVGVVITPYLPRMFGFLAYLGGTAVLWAALPSASAIVIQRFGGAMAARAAKAGYVAMLIAGRWTAARPGIVVRLTGVIVIGIGIVVQAQVWTSRLGDSSERALEFQRSLQDSVLVVSSPYLDRESIESFAGDLPVGSALLGVVAPEDETQPRRLWGSCAALDGLVADCAGNRVSLRDGDIRAQTLFGQFRRSGDDVHVRLTNERSAWPRVQELVVVSAVGTGGLAAHVNEEAHRAFAMAELNRPGDSWAQGSNRLTTISAWVVFLVTIVLSVLLTAMGFSSAAEFLTFTAALAPLTVLTERRRFVFGVAAWNLVVPCLIAVSAGVAIAAWQGNFFVAMSRSGELSWSLLVNVAVTAAVFSIAIGVAGGANAVRGAARWRPVAD